MDNERIRASIEYVREMFTDLWVDDIEGFSIGINAPINGADDVCAVLFDGDDGYLWQVMEPISLRELVELTCAIDAAITRLFTISIWHKKPDPMPSTITLETITKHDGFLSLSSRFALLLTVEGLRPIVRIFVEQDGLWSEIYKFHYFWLTTMQNTAHAALASYGGAPEREPHPI